MAAPQDAQRVGQLLGVRVRRRGLGAQHERHRLDAPILGELPEPAEQRHVAARAGRLLEADPRRVRQGRDPRLRVVRDGGSRVLGDRPRASQPVAEERAAAGAQPAPVHLETRRAEHAAALVARQVRDLHAAERAAHVGDIHAERRPVRHLARAARRLPVLQLDPQLDVAPPGGPEREAEGEAPVEHG